jgi:hypothetical protein
MQEDDFSFVNKEQGSSDSRGQRAAHFPKARAEIGDEWHAEGPAKLHCHDVDPNDFPSCFGKSCSQSRTGSRPVSVRKKTAGNRLGDTT